MRTKTRTSYQERILRVQLYIQHHLDDSLCLETLSRIAGFSPYHFHRIFHGMVGESVACHVKRLRMERAAQRLKQAKQTVLDIALDAGFQTAESFTRAFKEQFHITPSKHRKNGAIPMHKTIHSQTNIDSRTAEVRVVELPEKRVLFVRHTGPYQACGQAWELLCMWAGTRGYLQPGVEFIGLCHDDPDITPPENIRYDACICIETDVEPAGRIGIQTLAGGLYAVTTHFGSYSNLSETYAMLCGRWAPESGYELRSLPSREVYLNSPDDTAEEELITDVYVPIEK